MERPHRAGRVQPDGDRDRAVEGVLARCPTSPPGRGSRAGSVEPVRSRPRACSPSPHSRSSSRSTRRSTRCVPRDERRALLVAAAPSASRRARRRRSTVDARARASRATRARARRLDDDVTARASDASRVATSHGARPGPQASRTGRRRARRTCSVARSKVTASRRRRASRSTPVNAPASTRRRACRWRRCHRAS